MQAIMLGQQHLRKVMLGEYVVWQKSAVQPPIPDVTLESLTHEGIKLTATNLDGHLFYPMFFLDRVRPDYFNYHGKLTFIGDAWVSLQSIDAMLVGDVVDGDIHYPMFFFDEEPSEGKYDYNGRLTFIANEPEEDYEIQPQ